MSLLDNLTEDELQETPMIDIMYHYLSEERQTVDFYTLMNKIAKYKNWSEAEMRDKLVQAYTDMNIDGRFVSLGDNQWGLKSWYPVEQTEEELGTTIKPKKKKKAVDDDFDDYDDLEEELLEDEVIDDFEEDEEEDIELLDEEEEKLVDDDFLDEEEEEFEFEEEEEE